MMQTVTLTPEQAQELAPLFNAHASLPAGAKLIGELQREQFNGSNAATCGRWQMVVALVPEREVKAARKAIEKARTGRKT